MTERRDDAAPSLPYSGEANRERPRFAALSPARDLSRRVSTRLDGLGISPSVTWWGLALALVLVYGVLDTATTVAVWELLPPTAATERSAAVLWFRYAATRAEAPAATYAWLGVAKVLLAGVVSKALRRHTERWLLPMLGLLGASVYATATNVMILLGWV